MSTSNFGRSHDPGAVVLVDWPYSDRTGSKLRPAVVIQADFLNGLPDDAVLVQNHK